MDNPSDRLFVDTGYLIARFNTRDQYHERARGLEDAVNHCRELWTTDAVLLELGAAFSSLANRIHVISAWDGFHGGSPCRVVEASSQQLQKAMTLFRSRMDKILESGRLPVVRCHEAARPDRRPDGGSAFRASRFSGVDVGR